MKKSLFMFVALLLLAATVSARAATWTRQTLPGMPSNYNWAQAMVVYNGNLYFSAAPGDTGPGLIWKSDGATWTLLSVPGLTEKVGDMVVYNNALYVGMFKKMLKYDGTNWTTLTIPGLPTSTVWMATMAVYGGRLFLGTADNSGAQIWSFDGTTWTRQLPPGFTTANQAVSSMVVYGGKLYLGTDQTAARGKGEIWSYDGSTWSKGSIPGFTSVYIGRMTVYGNALYMSADSTLWKFDGASWSPVTIPGYSPGDYVAALAVHGGRLVLFTWDNPAHVWVFDGAAWTFLNPLAAQASQPYVGTTAVHGNVLYVGVGSDNSAPSEVWRLVVSPQVVEFYNTQLDNYFITANSAEQSAIGNGSAGPGWSRTGDAFSAGGPTPVCRFYGSISPGPNSHFYTANAAECQSLKDLQAVTPSTQKRWNFESLDFNTTSATNGGCAAGLTPVYRAYNNGIVRGVDSNHRITSSAAAIAEVVARGWISEGVVMCAQPW